MFGITSFVTSGILIVGLIALRHFEDSRGIRFLPVFRGKLDSGALFFVHYVIKEIPSFISRTFKYLLLQITHIFSASLLYIVRFIEQKLRIVVSKVSGKKRELERSEPVSNHLTDMKTHKEAVSKTIEELEEVK